MLSAVPLVRSERCLVGVLSRFALIFALMMCSVITVLAANPSAAATRQATGADRLVAIELEKFDSRSATATHRWSLVRQSGLSGGAGMSAEPELQSKYDSGYLTTSPRLDYEVDFLTAGLHYVWIRGIARDFGSDSVHVGLNGMAMPDADRIEPRIVAASSEWSSTTKDGAVATLSIPSPGRHTVNLWMREDGYVADKLVLTTSADYVPRGRGPVTFLQDSGTDGLVSLELEDFDEQVATDDHDWVFVADAGLSGGAAMRAVPELGVNNDVGYSVVSPRLDYRVEFLREGVHYVWVRGISSNFGNDSVHVGLNGRETAASDRIEPATVGRSPGWTNRTWDNAVAAVTVPAPGAHIISVWMREDGFVADKIVLTTNADFVPSENGPPASRRGARDGLALRRVGTEEAYFAYDGEPLLSFGGMSDWTFYLSDDAFDYRRWADWQAAHGMNHVRAGVADSWTFIEKATLENGGDPAAALFPFAETANSIPGRRQFDLSVFDAAYWARLREQLAYLQSKDIVVHLMMTHGLRLNPNRREHWEGHFFNPRNHVNGFENYLGPESDKRFNLWHSVADGERELWELQKRFWAKVIEETAEFDNVYYDLVTEMAENYDPTHWVKVKHWINSMALHVRETWSAINPDRPIILGMDSGSFDERRYRDVPNLVPAPDSETEFLFSNPNFDLLIWGAVHHSENFPLWRSRYRKPVVPQESIDELPPSGDDSFQKWTYRVPEMRVHLRQYLWRMMFAKAQQLDFYIKNDYGYPDPQTRYPHNYDPRGHSLFEGDAMKLRAFWDAVIDYPDLEFHASVTRMPDGPFGPAAAEILSSRKEALVYVYAERVASSPPANVPYRSGIAFTDADLMLRELALLDGDYLLRLYDPAVGLLSERPVRVRDGKVRLTLPAFTDDLALHLRPLLATASSGAPVP